MDDHNLLALLAKQDRDITAVGWAVTGVLPHGDEAPYAYTIGLTALTAPELVITGLHHDIAHALLNDMAARAHHDGERWRHHDRVADLLAGFDAAVINGTANDLITPGTANARYGAQRVRLQQIVWPDPDSRFPWDAGYRYPPTTQPLLTAATLSAHAHIPAAERRHHVTDGTDREQRHRR
jgi:Domain of unknown function (DUF4262)